MDYRKKGALVLSSFLEDLAEERRGQEGEGMKEGRKDGRDRPKSDMNEESMHATQQVCFVCRGDFGRYTPSRCPSLEPQMNRKSCMSPYLLSSWTSNCWEDRSSGKQPVWTVGLVLGIPLTKREAQSNPG